MLPGSFSRAEVCHPAWSWTSTAIAPTPTFSLMAARCSFMASIPTSGMTLAAPVLRSRQTAPNKYADCLSAADLRQAAARTQEAKVARRMLAIARVLEGCSRAEAGQTCAMDRQTLPDWVHRYNGQRPGWLVGPAAA
jgi:hypothetical protein